MFLKLQVFHFPRNKLKSHVFSFFKKRPSKLFNYRKTNICIPQEIFLFSTFDYSNLSFHFSNNQDKKKTFFTINKKKKKGKKTTSKVSKKQTSSKQRMNFLKYLQLPIFLIAFHFNASIHHRLHPSSLPTLAAIYRRTINFRREKRFLMHIAASYCWRWFKILYRHFCEKVRCKEETISRDPVEGLVSTLVPM